MSTVSLDCLPATPRHTSVPAIRRGRVPARTLTGRVVSLLARVRRWATLRRAARMLEEMPDHMLSDIGISRGEIHDVLREGRSWRDDPTPRT